MKAITENLQSNVLAFLIDNDYASFHVLWRATRELTVGAAQLRTPT
jgi:hypothetical protein